MDLQRELAKIVKGDVDATDEVREFYSHDASLFELKPEVVVFPKTAADIKAVVSFVAKNKKKVPNLSVTARSRGTDMSGAAINDSIILDTSKYMTKVSSVSAESATTEPGAMYKDFESETLKKGALLPSYPASRDLAGMGGIVNNNSGGEKSLRYGKTDKYVKKMKVVLSDGNEYSFEPLDRDGLNAKMAQNDFEGRLYRDTFEILDKHYDEIKKAAPNVTKDSTGYHLWNVWDKEAGIFDMTKLFVGAQGTLGVMTEASINLVPHEAHSGLLVMFLRDIDDLGELINVVLKYKPTSFESFDDATLWLSIKFMPYFLKMLGPRKFIHLLITLIPDGLQLLHGIPKMVLMAEFTGETEDEVRTKIKALHKELGHHKARYEINGFEEDATEGKAEKFWTMRRHSFNLLRSKVKDKHTAPFIDDFIVPPQHLPEFLPKMRAVVKKYHLFATIAGHMGDGNFHVIPLMKIEDPKERAKFEPVMKAVNEMVIAYGGSVSGEHNDGLIRGPWLKEMYSKDVLGYMKEVKHIFDPDDIFNPHKKTDATWEYSFSHIREHF